MKLAEVEGRYMMGNMWMIFGNGMKVPENTIFKWTPY